MEMNAVATEMRASSIIYSHPHALEPFQVDENYRDDRDMKIHKH